MEDLSYQIEDFDKIYIGWATNLMPNEINEEDVYYQEVIKFIS
jgi:hypothetical protein